MSDKVSTRQLPGLLHETLALATPPENGPLREIFRQMAAVPITVFSLTLPRGGGTMFFLRTPFTIKCLFDELAKTLPSERPAGEN